MWAPESRVKGRYQSSGLMRLTRPAEKVALEVKRKLVGVQGAREGYGVVVNEDFTVGESKTEELRMQMRPERAQLGSIQIYDRGGSIKSCERNAWRRLGWLLQCLSGRLSLTGLI